MRMMNPDTAPTIAAIGAECAWITGASAAASVGVAVLDMLCITVLNAVDSGRTKLTVKLLSADDVAEIEASILVVVDAEVEEVAEGRTVLVIVYDVVEA
jgi:hypothetical protein